jgi:hypothetical protein
MQRGYIADFIGRTEDLIPCENCGAQYVSYSARDNHVVKTQHSHQDGHVTANLDSNISRTREQEDAIKPVTRMEDAEPGGMLAQIGEIDQHGRTVPAEYSESAQVRAQARRGRPRKRR